MKYFFLALTLFLFVCVGNAHASLIDDLKRQIAEKEKEILELEAKSAAYQNQLEKTKAQRNTLQYELSRIEKEIIGLTVSIKKTQTTIIETDIRIEELKNLILFKEDEIRTVRDRLGEMLRLLNERDKEGLVSLIFSVRTFSELFSQQEYLISLQKEVHANLSNMQAFKRELESFKKSQEAEKEKVDALYDDLASERQIADNERKAQQTLLTQTRNQEKEYQRLLTNIEAQRSSIEKEITVLEAKLRLAIDKSKLPVGTILSWPLDSVRITQGYGKPNWKAAYDFHNGIDLGGPIGTPVRAALGGKVVGVGDNGRYAYGKWIAIDHGNLNITTLYGHLSLQKAKAGQSIQTGDVIGYVGTTGYSTGPHLHFTVFATESYTLLESTSVKNLWIPVGASLNPLDYLP